MPQIRNFQDLWHISAFFFIQESLWLSVWRPLHPSICVTLSLKLSTSGHRVQKLVIERCRHPGEQVADFQMLRTYPFTFPAFDTVRCPSMSVSGYNVVIIIPGIPVMKGFMRIQRRKEIRNADSFRAFAFFDTIPAGSTRDQIQSLKDVADLPYRLMFCFCQRLKLFHCTYIIFHLRHVTHSG